MSAWLRFPLADHDQIQFRPIHGLRARRHKPLAVRRQQTGDGERDHRLHGGPLRRRRAPDWPLAEARSKPVLPALHSSQIKWGGPPGLRGFSRTRSSLSAAAAIMIVLTMPKVFPC